MPLERLTELFKKFPGIGPRQAERFSYHLLHQDAAYVDELLSLIRTIKSSVRECSACFRYFSPRNGESVCGICSSERDHTQLMIVERDQDILPIERTKVYGGYYFVLGGTIPLLDHHHTSKIRGTALKAMVEKRIEEGLLEVIIAFGVNPDGENTARYVESELAPFVQKEAIRITLLGRGLSTGSEIEYADTDTIKNAFKNRFRTF